MSHPATSGLLDALWTAFRPRASTLHWCPLLGHSSPVRRALAERRSEPTEIEPHATRATGLRRTHTARSLDVPSTLTDVPLSRNARSPPNAKENEQGASAVTTGPELSPRLATSPADSRALSRSPATYSIPPRAFPG